MGSSDHIKVADLHGMPVQDFFATCYSLTASHCCVCALPLRDALSVQLMIGPVCRKRYGYLDLPENPNMPVALGLVAALEQQDNIKPMVVRYLLANRDDPRMMCNILTAFASVHYSDKTLVLAASPIIRALGYPKLAEKLEWDRSVVQIRRDWAAKRIEVYTPYNRQFVVDLHKLTGQSAEKVYNERKDRNGNVRQGKFKCWSVPERYEADLMALIRGYYEGQSLYDGEGVSVIPGPTDAEKAVAQKAKVSLASQVRIEPGSTSRGRVAVFSPPPWENDACKAFVDGVRNIRGRSFDRDRKCWTVPAAALQRVEDLKTQHFGAE